LRTLGALLIATIATGAASAAQSEIQTQRLIATRLALDAAPTSSALASIWQDKLRAEQAKFVTLPKAAPYASTPSVPVFVATFRDGDRTIILSALFTTPECRNFSGAASPSLNNCPVRVAVLRDDKVKVVVKQDDFPFAAAMKDAPDTEVAQYDNQTPRDKTVVTFNAVTHEITTAVTLNGVLDMEISMPIHIAY
jgi:hypothetical protein